MRTHSLTAEEETALGRRARSGDLSARNQLVTANLGLAKSICRKHPCWEHGPKCDDLEQRVFVALCEAPQYYDPDSYPGVRFATFVYPVLARVALKGCERKPRLRTIPLQSIPEAAAPAAAEPEAAPQLGPVVGALGGLDAVVLRLRYPLDGSPRETLRKLGAMLGVSHQQAARLEGRALERLRVLYDDLKAQQARAREDRRTVA
jgi:RNA polymerase sigma factor (sigma-70 family)